MPQTAIPCVLMRGGTSKGPYFRLSDLPSDPETRDQVLLAAMGSPDARQIDGLGGADTLTSKVAMVGPSERDGVDVDYLFAQVDINRAHVDVAPSCGNILSGVGPFAVETGMVTAQDGETDVRVYNINTGSRIDIKVQTPGGHVEYQGDARIDGVPGRAAPVLCKYMDVTGSKTGKLLPTGQAREVIQGLNVSCVDVSVPMVFFRASELGLSGGESRDEINANRELLDRIERVRLEAGERMGLGDVDGSVVPKVAILSAPEGAAHIRSRYLTPLTCHAAHAVTGSMCLAACVLQPGTIADDLSRSVELPRVGELAEIEFELEHTSGGMSIEVGYRLDGEQIEFVYGGVLRTARRIMQGEVLIPADVWVTG